MKKAAYALLVTIFIFTLASRLYFSFSVPNYSSDEAYFNIRQMEHIQQTSRPLYDDELSFSGRRFVFPPLFGYALAFIGLIFPLDFTAKFFPALFASSIVFFAYLMARRLSKNRAVALVTALISGFVPVFFQQTFNSISIYSIVMPLFFLLLYSFMNLKKQKWAYCYIITIILLTFIHPSAILFVLGLWFYLLLVKLEGLKHDKAELEIVIFSTFFVMLSQFLMFKKVFLYHGSLVIWQNMPKELLSNYFSQISLLQAGYYIGVIPAFCGIYIIYRYIFKEKQHDLYLLIGFVFSVALLLWLRLIKADAGLMFLGLIILLLFARFCMLFMEYIHSTRAARFANVITALFFITAVMTSIIPAFSLAQVTLKTSVTDNEIAALEWIRDNTPEGSVVLGTAYEGNLITAISKRRNVADLNFLMISDAEQRMSDIRRMYTTVSMTEAIDLLGKYSVDYIYISPKARQAYGIQDLGYADSSCFIQVYSKDSAIYYPICRMEERK